MKMKGCLFLLMFLLCTVSVLAEAQLVNAALVNATGPVVIVPYTIGPKVNFSPMLTNASGVHIITSKELTNATQEKINSLEVQPNEIFSPVLSEVTNLKVDPTVEGEKVVYRLELAVNTPIHRDQEVVSPIFDLRVDGPVEFKLHDQKIVINDEQIIDYKEVMKQIVRENEVFPPIQLEVQSEINSEIYDLRVIPGINSTTAKFIYREREVLMPIYSDFKVENKRLYLIESNKVYDLRVLPLDIVTPVFSEVNLEIYSAIESDKVVYHIEPRVNTPIYREKEVVQPVFDLRVDEPVEFKIHDNKIVIDDKQVIEYKKVMDQIVREKEVFPPIIIELQSGINSEVYDLTVIPGINSTTTKFIYREKEVLMPIHNDFKIENKKLYLIKNNKVHDLKVLPPEIYSAVHSGVEKYPEVTVKNLSLKIEDEEAIYDLRVEQPAKLLWIIPWTVESRYVIDPADGSAKLVNKPWYITSVKIGEDDDDIVILYPEHNPL